MTLVPYVFLRGLELEGRHPNDVGGWHVTIRRMEVGEGVPIELDPAHMVEAPAGEVYPPAPKLSQERRFRFFYYRRIRSATECERYLERVNPDPEVPVCVDLYPSWIDPPGGVIPMPNVGDQRLDTTHLVVLSAFSAVKREFQFRNTWGDSWGEHGYGSLPYDYFDEHVFESWVTYHETQVSMESQKLTRAGGRQDRRWVVRDEWDRRVYGFEVLDEPGEDRLAWSFVLEKDGALEIEELYVRPEYRRKGYGKVLAEKVRELAAAKCLPLRLWVPFADTRQENTANYPALVAIARLLGVQFHPCPAVWAAYFATNERSGLPDPIEPARIPPRPKSALQAVIAMTTAMSSGITSHTGPQTPAVAANEEDSLPTPGTEAWAAMNRRRADLIRKKNRGGLSPEEQLEYLKLQHLSQAALERAFPAPTGVDDELARIEASLGITPGASQE
jgi:GNAT superfamily N-acetyltransferase